MKVFTKQLVFAFSFISAFYAQEQNLLANVEQLENTMQGIVNEDSKAGTTVKNWHQEQDDLINELRQIKIETQWLELQKKKYTGYVSSNQRKIEEIENTNSRYAVIALQLESAMIDYLEDLKTLVNSDLPFSTEERKNRIIFLQNSLEDPDLSLGEKFRRFSEALNVEAAYGTDAEVTFQNADFDGKQTELITIRLGRVGFYALTLDLKQSGIWNKGDNSFKKASEEEHKIILALHDAINSKQFIDLIPVPMEGATNAN